MKTMLTALLVLPLVAADVANPKAQVAWGKTTGGLQLGITLHKDHAPRHAANEHVKFDVRVKNVSEQPVEYTHRDYDAFYTPPVVRDAAGKDVKVLAPTVQFLGAWAIHKFTLAPGKARHLATITMAFDPDAPDRDDRQMIFVAKAGNGRYKIVYQAARDVPVERNNPERLESGALDIQVGE